MDSLKQLTLAFGVSIGRAVIDADRDVNYAEFSLFGRIFPRVLLREAGFVDDQDQFTEHLAEAWLQACKVLPEALSEGDKLDLLTLFHGTSMADGHLDAREEAVIREAAALLGVSADAFDHHLAD